MSELKAELRRLADEAARQARPLPVADVIREGERRHRRTISARRRPSAPEPGLATGAQPARRQPGWVAPLASAAAVTAVIAAVVTVSGAIHSRKSAGPAAATVYVAYESSCVFTVPNNATGSIIPISTGASVPGTPIHVHGLAGSLTATPGGKIVYTDTSNSVIPISTATGRLGKPISIGSGNTGEQIAITPDGKTAYVLSASAFGDSTVTPINIATSRPGKPISLGPGAEDYQIAITPDGKTAYVLDASFLGYSTVIPISTATNKPGKPIRVGPGAQAIVFTPDGKTAYVNSEGSEGRHHLLTTVNFVTPINTATNTAGQPIPVSAGAATMAITPDGKTLFTAGRDAVTPISTASNTPGKPIRVGASTNGAIGGPALAITPDGETLYVLPEDANGSTAITPISIATNTPGKSIGVPGPCANFAMTPDGKTLYVASQGRVVPINTVTNVPGNPVPVPAGLGFPAAIVVAPAAPAGE